MSEQAAGAASVRRAVEELIEAGTGFDIDALERIYHEDLQVLSIDDEGTLTVADKAMFKGLFEMKKAAGAPPLNTWALWHHVQVHAETAHVLITRKVNLIDQDQKLTLSIDLVHEDGRWQVIREVIFVRPDD